MWVPFFFQVLLRTFNQGIYYEYWLPKQSHNPSRGQYPTRRAANGYPTTASTTIHHSTVVHTTRHHRPTKPAYAYGYGEKPYRSQDAPVFRRYTPSTTTLLPKYKTQPYAVPHYSINADSSTNSNNNHEPTKKDLNPLYKPRVFKPSGGYYQNYRNVSTSSVVNKLQDLDQELPVLTQPDSSGSVGKGLYDNIIPNTVLDNKQLDQSVPKSQKPLRTSIQISKRGEKARNFVTNGRLKYSLQDADDVFVNSSGRYTPAPLAIALLPSPDDNRAKSNRSGKKGGKCFEITSKFLFINEDFPYFSYFSISYSVFFHQCITVQQGSGNF